MFCRQCGKIIPAESVYCPECGAPTKNVQKSAEMSTIRSAPVQPIPTQSPEPMCNHQKPEYSAPRSKEQYIVKCKKHWGMFVGRGIVSFLLLLIGAFMISDAPGYMIFGVIMTLILIVPLLISYATDYIALTDTKIVWHSGLLNSSQKSAPISKIQNIELSNGLGGKIFGYHDILVDNAGTGGKEFRFRKATNAEEFAEAVYARMK